MKKTILILASTFSLYAGSLDKAYNDVQAELTPQEYKSELSLFQLYKKQIFAIEELEKNAYQKGSKARFTYLDELLDIQKTSRSIIVSQLLLDKSLQYINLKNIKYFNKYVAPASSILYKNEMCDGYLFEGIKEESINGNIQRAMEIYTKGLKNCSVEWKRFQIIGRINKIKYNQGMMKK